MKNYFKGDSTSVNSLQDITTENVTQDRFSYDDGSIDTNNGSDSSQNSSQKDFISNIKNKRIRNFLEGFKRAEHHDESSLANVDRITIAPSKDEPTEYPGNNQYQRSSPFSNGLEDDQKVGPDIYIDDLENKQQVELIGTTIQDEELLPGQKKEDSNAELRQTIKPRHVIMMSLGTGIGTGLLVGNAKPLAAAGPAPLVIGYGIMGTCIYCIIQACGEMAVAYGNLTGSFNTFPSFLVDPGFNFAVAWVYCIQWLCVCPLELVTASMTIQYWTTKVDPDVFVVIFYVLILLINFFGAKGYAEAEFIFNTCKVLMICGFFILAICIDTGAAGTDGYIGAKYWNDPGAFRGQTKIERFKGVMDTFVTAAFAFGATEFIALTAAEQSNPRKAIPSAAKKIIYRVLVIFLNTIILIGFLVPYDSDQLLGSGGSATKASPYVLAISLHGVRVAQHFVNAVILISVISVGNSAFYSSSRLLMSLAQQGSAPKIFDYVDREGRPLIAMCCSAVIAVIAFCATSPKETEVFTWLMAIAGLSQLFTWFAICLSHLRFRRAMKVQGRSLGEMGYLSQTGILGSLYAAIMMILALIAQFWVALVPMGTHTPDANSFFSNYLAMPILIVFYFGYKIWKRDWRLFIRAKDIDLISHRTIYDEELLRQEDEEYREKLRNGPKWKRVAAFWC
ncbi:hypothetical protein TBLA_0A05180 [Henningerozyma blattae CBS 6284]|uniref:Amino acid permease/ SLC12A domain-containing protein n=1 Tax=Henningerozyma blattae (strain ATCC 34711 / CBS 6284 / DSM 70876 / NBRC 10599 / NRRL Y-10934 / UCD 77-7) TaxID=1071380 RepID=I2GW09_HENB6|nr:hypothetical protein TBLA_0A05180 [Tetrapisispora blattae CBS 6284]CCH58311.1 hypothetical protein TBLA_0A05180 [Tetrapisispora blattae CBS 6284]